MKRTGAFWKGCLCVLFLLCVAATVEGAPRCRNPIPSLGGSTAIRRGDPLDSVSKLKAALATPKYRKAFEEILELAGMAGAFEELKKVVEDLEEPQDLQSYSQGTGLAWMAYRRDGKIRLLPDACWANDEPFRAWTFDFRGRKLLIPEKCLNLAELKAPTCQIQAQADCSTSEVTAQVTVEPLPGYTVKSVGLTSSLLSPEGAGAQAESQGNRTEPPFEWTFEVKESGTYRLEAKATAADQRAVVESPVCSAEVRVCKRCVPPSCRLKVGSTWRAGEGTLQIDAEGSDGDLEVTVRKPDGSEVKATPNDHPSQWIVTVSQEDEGSYEVTLKASRPGDSECMPVTCSAVVPVLGVDYHERRDWELWIEELEGDGGECCKSPWVLRTFGLYTTARGKETKGTLRQDQSFKLDFNQGLGFGMDLEYLRGAQENQGSRLSGWGWSFGVSRVSIDTVWTLDSATFWMRDDDRVPMLTLTAGPRYHWSDGGRWNLHASPLLGFVRFDSATYADGTPLPGTFRAGFENRFAFGADVGFDAFLGDCWGLTGGAQYLKISTGAGDIDIDVDPMTLRGGVIYRF